jgi:hypothetical protein
MRKGLGYSDWRFTLLPCYHFEARSWAGNIGRVYRPQPRRGWKGWDMLTGTAPVMKAAPQGAARVLGLGREVASRNQKRTAYPSCSSGF